MKRFMTQGGFAAVLGAFLLTFSGTAENAVNNGSFEHLKPNKLPHSWNFGMVRSMVSRKNRTTKPKTGTMVCGPSVRLMGKERSMEFEKETSRMEKGMRCRKWIGMA